MAKPAAKKTSKKVVSKKSAKKAAPAKVVKKKRKAKKDPNAPKGASSGFMQFSQAERPRVQEENPDMKITEISKVLGQLWRGMDDNQKKPFNKKAAIDKERYHREMAAYKAKKAEEEEEEEEEEEDEEEEEESEEEDSD